VVVNYRGQADRAAQIVAEINAAEALATVVRSHAGSGGDIATSGAQALFAAAVKAFGAVSVLVNNASPRINPSRSARRHDVQQQMDVQVKGAFLMTSAVTPEMVRGGRIVNITSQVLDGPPSVTWTGYAMAKGALQVFSNYMAAELGRRALR
jgi:3-oxoacyl-[acyl-carrier protein] reductase